MKLIIFVYITNIILIIHKYIQHYSKYCELYNIIYIVLVKVNYNNTYYIMII